jgi:hypothetical protein
MSTAFIADTLAGKTPAFPARLHCCQSAFRSRWAAWAGAPGIQSRIPDTEPALNASGESEATQGTVKGPCRHLNQPSRHLRSPVPHSMMNRILRMAHASSGEEKQCAYSSQKQQMPAPSLAADSCDELCCPCKYI